MTRARFETVVADQSRYGGARPTLAGGLGDEAFTGCVTRPAFCSASLHIRSSNVIITIAYAGSDAGHRPVSTDLVLSGVMTAGRAVLTALTT